tara:strand:+ start:4976 stop:5185 length:210 start_codon:yes stop_codon:yes gene_type:complete
MKVGNLVRLNEEATHTGVRSEFIDLTMLVTMIETEFMGHLGSSPMDSVVTVVSSLGTNRFPIDFLEVVE